MKNIIVSEDNNSRLDISNIGIFYNKDNEKAYIAAKETADIFNQNGIECRMLVSDEFNPDITFAAALGGDGTILKAARYYASYNVPVFGINLGRLGFLSQAKSSGVKEAAAYIKNGQFRIENRMMLSALSGSMQALNDIVIKSESSFRGGFTRTSRMYVHINGRIVCDYLADGIIVSTPTGSTAYNLSAGGPVLHPLLDAIVITPICPHSMSARPLAAPSSEVITVTASSDMPAFKISADGQDTKELSSNAAAEIVKSRYSAKLLLLNTQKNSFYSVLKEKLNWGFSWQG